MVYNIIFVTCTNSYYWVVNSKYDNITQQNVMAAGAAVSTEICDFIKVAANVTILIYADNIISNVIIFS